MFHTPPKMVQTRGAIRREGETQPIHEESAGQSSQSAPATALAEVRDIKCNKSLKSRKSSRRSVTSSTETKRKILELELQAAQEKAKIRMELIDKQLEVNIASLEQEENQSYSSQDEEEEEAPPVYVNKWLEGLKHEPISANAHGSSSSELPTAPAQQQAPPAADELAEPRPAPPRTMWYSPLATPPPKVAAPSLPPEQATTSPAQLKNHPQPPLTALPAPEVPPPPVPAHKENYVSTAEATIQTLASALKNMTTNAVASGRNANHTNLLSRICTPRDLPEYSGDPLDFIQFKLAYEESSNVCNFTDTENLWRLRKCLRGAAKEAVSALLISAKSPDKILETLELRFGNPEYLLSKIVQDIKKLQPMTNEYQKDIVVFSCKIQNFVEAARAVEREQHLYGMNVVPTILSKLPSILLAKWTDYSYPLIKEGKKSRLLILSEFLQDEAKKVSTTTNIYYMGHCDNFKSKVINHPTSHHRTFLVQAERSTIEKCSFCKASVHKLTACKKFKRALRKVRWDHVKRTGICFKCLDARHNRDACPAPACDQDSCNQAHHKLLHYPTDRERSNLVVQPPSDEDPNPPVLSETVTHITASEKCKVLLKVVPIRIHGPNGVFSASALLDDGSTVSLISGELAARAGLRGRRQAMRVSGAWTDNELVCESTVMNVNISGMDSKIKTIVMRSVNELNLPIQKLSVVNCNKYEHLMKIKSSLCISDCKPEILIGQDNYHLLLPLEVKLGKSNEPSATLTPLGWCVHGTVPVLQGPHHAREAVCFAHTEADSSTLEDTYLLQDIHEEVRRSFALDTLGISGKPRQNANDVRAEAHLQKTAELIDGCWHVGLPWKDENCQMPDSFPNALKRFTSIERKMRKDKGFAQRYADRIKHLLDSGYARELTSTELKDSPAVNKIWYLSHFGVDNPYKKKLRLVFDGAGKVEGSCLNDYLLTGPDLLLPLFGIMLRFRSHPVAVTGDIKDMFLRVKIRKEDQHALRFLWRDNPSEPIKTYVMTSLIFGANCSPFVAQFVKNINAARYESSLPAAVDAIRNSHYMDDYIHSLPDEATAIDMVKNISHIYSQGNFEIRNWTSNSLLLLESVPKDTLGPAAIKFKLAGQNEGERTLGLIWFPKTDELGFDVSFKRIPENVLLGKERPTKRIMLRVIMSIFDIYGILSPLTVQGRIMLQDAWRLNLEWDNDVPDSIYSKWCCWIDLLKDVNKMRVPRYYRNAAGASETETQVSAYIDDPSSCRIQTPNAAPPAAAAPTHSATDLCYGNATADAAATNCYDNLQLHIFSDASAKAMCAVAYWRWIENGKIKIALIGSKCRVMPVKSLTMPRAELQASLLSARFADAIIREHKMNVTRRVFWCDSTTVLHWIRNNTRTYKTFEANRLGEIDELTKISEWRYVPTKLNAADLATREVFDKALFQREWFTGPNFLYKTEEFWPVDVIQVTSSEGDHTCVTAEVDVPVDLPVPDPSRFSSWLRLLRATAAVLVFVDRCRKRKASLDCDTLKRAECMLIKYAQNTSFAEEIAAIRNERSLSRTSKLLTLTPYLDSCGILRVGGRIDAAQHVDLELKRPVILDGRNPVARLLVRHYHVKAAHGNQETVVNNLKQKYWIIRMRPTVKYIASKCMLCKIRKCKPYVPRMGDLPAARMAHHHRPFSFCGLDLFGPVEVAVGRRREKRYGVLFTCLTVRAVHIELVSSLSTDSLIMALRRMAARRGWPNQLYSDNGTNLRGADKELQRSLNELDVEALKNEGVSNGMEWCFIPPASPHWGGSWERLIRSVKTSLQVILKERAPREEVLITLLAEVENMVNSRPLTHVSVEPGSPETLTPNHFLLGESSNLPIIGAFNDDDLCLRKQWRKAQRLADMYWARWMKEVLPEMLPRKKWNCEQRSLQVGDCVFVVDPSMPRNVWPRGIVIGVYPGKDQRVRLVDVRTKTGVLRRSAARVAPFLSSGKCCASTGGEDVSDALIK